MSEQRPQAALAALGDDELAGELRSLAGWLEVPFVSAAADSADPAHVARLRLEAGAGRSRGWPFRVRPGRPFRRSLVLAIVVLIVLVAIVGAIGFGVPGIRIIFLGATPIPSFAVSPATPSPAASASPSPSPIIPGALGSDLDLGVLTTTTQAPSLTGWPLLLPADPTIGPPDAVWYREGRINLLWKSRAGLPDTNAPGIGLLVTEFHGTFDRDYFEKIVGPDTVVVPASVGGTTGYWIAGAVHDFFYVNPSGGIVNDSRRVVGDTLIWTHGVTTFRLETSLGEDAAIRIAMSMR
jgi:hypothetical protein